MRIRSVALAVYTTLVTFAILTLAPFACAQNPDQTVATNVNSSVLVAWCGASYALIGMVGSAIREDNPAVAVYVKSKRVRMLILFVLGIAEAFSLSVIHGLSWTIALPIGISSSVAAYITHGVRTTPGATAEEAAVQKSGRPPALDEKTPPLPPPTGEM